jgi:hypothetical protein
MTMLGGGGGTVFEQQEVIKNNKLLLKLEPELKHNKPRLDL